MHSFCFAQACPFPPCLHNVGAFSLEMWLLLGTLIHSEMDEFPENLRRGGGGINNLDADVLCSKWTCWSWGLEVFKYSRQSASLTSLAERNFVPRPPCLFLPLSIILPIILTIILTIFLLTNILLINIRECAAVVFASSAVISVG